jgi:small subunit ribosomal protein S5
MTKKEIEEQEQKTAKLEQRKQDREVLKETKAEEAKIDEVKIDEVKVEEVKVDAVKVDTAKTNEVKTKKVKIETVERSTFEARRNDPVEIKEVLVSVNRTTKVVKGGRRFSFAAVVVVGDGQGRVGYGLGKAKEILEARGKASQTAKKSMIKVNLKDNRTIYHDIVGKFGSGHVVLRSAKVGTGVIAGGPMRSIFEMLGVHDIVAKSIGSSNVHNIIGATFDALRNLCAPDYIRNKRAIES